MIRNFQICIITRKILSDQNMSSVCVYLFEGIGSCDVGAGNSELHRAGSVLQAHVGVDAAVLWQNFSSLGNLRFWFLVPSID